METNLQSIPTQFGEPRLGMAGDRPNWPRASEPITQFYRYRNFTNSPISIGWRNGLKVRIPHEPMLAVAPEFITIVEISMDAGCTADAERALASLPDDLSPEIAALRKSLQSQLGTNGNIHRTARIVLDYPLSQEQLEAAGGTVYFSELDIVVSLLPPDSMPPHPYSEQGRRTRTFAGSPIDQGGVGFGYAIELVDNHQRYGKRYINIAGQVYPVEPKRDIEKRDGVYVISHVGVDAALQKTTQQVRYCSFEQAQETLGLYRTAEEAMHLGDLTQARKAELIGMEHELLKSKGDLQLVKTQAEKADLLRREEVAKLEGENERLKARNQLLERDMEIERQRTKDVFEQKSYNRKDTSEQIKILPTIILGITTIIATLFGIFGGNKKTA